MFYIRPSKRLTSRKINNIIWRIINEGCLPPEHSRNDVYVDVTQEELNKLMDALIAHPRLRSHRGVR